MVAVSSVGVFCGSSAGRDGSHAQLASELGALVAAEGLTLVYGGGHTGLMGALADRCVDAGGDVVGVIPTGLFTREIAHRGIGALHEVGTMHERKQLMYDLADGFVALPGGLGTLEEAAEVVTWTQLGIHTKPLVLLDADGFWDPLVAQLDRMVDDGFLKPANRALVERHRTPADALAALRAADPVYVEKWD